MKVSVIIPVFNPGEYLRPCVESLLDQGLSAEEYELIFVDDGSTDATPHYLDGLAAIHSNVTAIHQDNSGWPGQPRNVGLDAARGEYVFFCDHDDWLGAGALVRLYDFAVDSKADVVLPKTAGLGRRVPYHVFNKTRAHVSLADAPLMDSLTPHKLFRREFLNRHHIRFPEGRRRLEDHYFVVTCYLLADVVSIYSDYTCYYHMRRPDGGNAGLSPINWHGYFTNLIEAIEVVERHTEAGPFRDLILRRWLQVEVVARLSGKRRLQLGSDAAQELFGEAHRVAAGHFGPGVVALLPPVDRPVARAIIDGDAEAVLHLSESLVRWTVEVRLLQVHWTGDTLQIAGFARLVEVTAGSDPNTEGTTESAFVTLFDDLDQGVIAAGMNSPALALDLSERASGERWPVPLKLTSSGLTSTFIADIDPTRLAFGAPLREGIWDLSGQFRVLGVGGRERMAAVPQRWSADPMTHQTDGRRTTAYLTKGNKTLALKVALAHDENTPAAPQQSTDRPDATSVKTPANGSTEPLAHTSTVARKLARRLRARRGHRSE